MSLCEDQDFLEANSLAGETSDKTSELPELRLEQEKQELKKELDSKRQHTKELEMLHKKSFENNLCWEIISKEVEAHEAAENAQKEPQELLQIEQELQRKNEKLDELTGIKEELDLKVQKASVYKNIMEQLAKTSGFEDVDSFALYLQHIFNTRDRLQKMKDDLDEQIKEKQKQLATMREQYNINVLKIDNELHQLKKHIQETQSKYQILEKKWENMRENADKKMEISSIYEKAHSTFQVEEESVALSDIEKLEQIKQTILDMEDTLKMYRTDSGGLYKQQQTTKKPPKTASKTQLP